MEILTIISWYFHGRNISSKYFSVPWLDWMVAQSFFLFIFLFFVFCFFLFPRLFLLHLIWLKETYRAAYFCEHSQTRIDIILLLLFMQRLMFSWMGHQGTHRRSPLVGKKNGMGWNSSNIHTAHKVVVLHQVNQLWIINGFGECSGMGNIPRTEPAVLSEECSMINNTQ